MSNLEILAKYPFLSEAKDFVKSLNLSLDDILKHPVYSSSFELGRQRLLNSLNNRVSPDLEDRVGMELTILSYPIARILANLTKNQNVIRRYAQGEANSAYELLKSEDKRLVETIKRDLAFPVEGSRIKVLDYVRLSSNLARFDPRWRLVNRVVDRGNTSLSDSEVLALLREQIRSAVEEPVPLASVPDMLKKQAAKVKDVTFTHHKSMKIEQLDDAAIPPCIKELISLLESGNLNHNGMFILGTFFAGLGLTKEAILKIFERSPKYNETVAGYQLDFLMGSVGGTKYSCPSCPKIKSYGFCKQTCNVKHPLQYYRQHSRRRR